MIPMMIITTNFITYNTQMVAGLLSVTIFKIEDLGVVAVVVVIFRRRIKICYTKA